MKSVDTKSMKFRTFFSPKNSSLLLAASALAGIAKLATPYMFAASFAYFCMVAGVLSRADKKTHSRLMTVAIVTDLAIVLTLETQRQAVKTAIAMTLSPLQQAHIASSFLATALYFPVFYLGWRRLKGKGSPLLRRWHVGLGVAAFIFRTAGFFLMFTLLSRVSPQ